MLAFSEYHGHPGLYLGNCAFSGSDMIKDSKKSWSKSHFSYWISSVPGPFEHLENQSIQEAFSHDTF